MRPKLKIIIYIMILNVLIVCLLYGCSLIGKNADDTATPPVPSATIQVTPAPSLDGHIKRLMMETYNAKDAIEKIENGELDVYASGISLIKYQDELINKGIDYTRNANNSYEISLNTVDTRKTADKLNPFYSKLIREAVNYLVDREYLCDEIFNKLAYPKYVALDIGSADYSRYIDIIRQVEVKYAYNKEKALDMIHDEMIELGATQDNDGQWIYKKDLVSLEFIIRSDDIIRTNIGDYVANELTDAGFTVNKQYLTYDNASSIWGSSDGYDGLWNMYTGAWIVGDIERNSSDKFIDGYTNNSTKPYRVYRALEVEEDFLNLCIDLSNNAWTSYIDRADMFEKALFQANEYSNTIWVAQTDEVALMSREISIMKNSPSSIITNEYTPYIIQGNSEDGILRWGSQSALKGPINPLGGSTSNADMQYINFTQDYGLIKNPYTGLSDKKWVKSASIILDNSIYVENSSDWVNVSYANEIRVPNDAYISWNVENQSFIMADKYYLANNAYEASIRLSTISGDKDSSKEDIAQATLEHEQALAVQDRGYISAMRMSRVIYEDSLFSLKWHDGTNLSVADFIMAMIVKMEISNSESNIYDAGIDDALKIPKSFKGFSIISQSPLTIEYYSDDYYLDAADNIETLWPDYGSAQSSWQVMAVSSLAVQNDELTFSKLSASESKSALWMNWLFGEGISVLDKYSRTAHTENYIPYENTMRDYLSTAQIEQAYGNLITFYEANRHFVIGLGPYYIKDVSPNLDAITLSESTYYPKIEYDYSHLQDIPVPIIEISNQDKYSLDDDILIDTLITYGDDNNPFPAEWIDKNHFLLYTHDGETVLNTSLGQPLSEGVYRLNLKERIELDKGIYYMEIVTTTYKSTMPIIYSKKLIIE